MSHSKLQKNISLPTENSIHLKQVWYGFSKKKQKNLSNIKSKRQKMMDHFLNADKAV